VFWGLWTFLGVLWGFKNDGVCRKWILVKSIPKVLISMSLVRPKLVQWSTSQRILIEKIIKKNRNRRFWDPPIRALFWALFSLCGLPYFPFVGPGEAKQRILDDLHPSFLSYILYASEEDG